MTTRLLGFWREQDATCVGAPFVFSLSTESGLANVGEARRTRIRTSFSVQRYRSFSLASCGRPRDWSSGASIFRPARLLLAARQARPLCLRGLFLTCYRALLASRISAHWQG